MAKRERRETPASGEVEKRVLLELFRAGDRCRRFIAALLAPWGLTPQQFNVLRILRGAGPEGLPTLAVGERMLERTPGVTRMIDRLEGRGLVIRRRCTEDRRKVFCAIAPAGLELLARLDDPVAAGDRRCVEELSAADAETLVGLLARCGPRAPA